jgi:hypothetical protein
MPGSRRNKLVMLVRPSFFRNSSVEMKWPAPPARGSSNSCGCAAIKLGALSFVTTLGNDFAVADIATVSGMLSIGAISTTIRCGA